MFFFYLLNVLQTNVAYFFVTALAIEYANRYMQSTFCSWYSTGGGIPGLLEPLSPEALNATGAQSTDQGHMFEKFNS